MSMPDVWCEIGFVKDPSDGSPLWRDVTADVEWQDGVRISRRRSHELDEIQPGTLSLTLNNPDGHYTAGNVSSPYYPNVKINRAIRIRARWPAGSANMLQEGQAKGSDASLFSGSFGTVTIDTGIFPAGQTSSAKWTGFSTGNLFRVGSKSTSSATDQSLPVVAGSTYSVRCQARRDTNTVSVRAQLRWYDEDGNSISNSTGSTVALTTSFQAVSVSATAPAGSVFARTVLECTIAAGGAIVYSSAWQFERAASPTTWVSPGAEYVQYQGYVDRWPHAWENGVRGKTQITATDLFKLLERQLARNEAVTQEILQKLPTFYYPCTELEGASATGNIATSSQPDLAVAQVGTGGSLTFGTDGGPLGSAMVTYDPVDVDNGKTLMTQNLLTMLGGGGSITIAAWVRADDSFVGASCLLYVGSGDQAGQTVLDGTHLYVGYNAPTASIDYFGGVVSGSGVGSFTSVDLGNELHMVVLVGTVSSGNLRFIVYVDGVLARDDTSALAVPTTWPINIKLVSAGGIGHLHPFRAEIFKGQISHVAGWNRALSSTEIATLYDAGSALTELSGSRIDKLLQWADVTETSVDPGLSLLDVTAYSASESPLRALRAAAFSEGGLLFIARDGVATFHDRDRRQAPDLAPLITLSADQCGPSLDFIMDDTLLVNDVTVQHGAGATRVTNADSVDEYGRYATTISTLLASGDDAIQRGSYLLGRFAEPAPRAGQATVEARSMPALWPSLLGCDIGHRLDITSLPSSAPASALQLWVEGVQGVITDETWHFTLDTSPASGQSLLLDDPVYGLLDSNVLGW